MTRSLKTFLPKAAAEWLSAGAGGVVALVMEKLLAAHIALCRAGLTLIVCVVA